MRKNKPLSEIIKNEQGISPSITKEQVYENLVLSAFNEIYDAIERNAKQGNPPHFPGSLSKFPISEKYYRAMMEKECDYYGTSVDSEYGPNYYLTVPQLFQVIEKHGVLHSKCTVLYTQFGKRFIADLQKKFRPEGIALTVNPKIRTNDGFRNVQIGVAFPTPSGFGEKYGVIYDIVYDVLN